MRTKRQIDLSKQASKGDRKQQLGLSELSPTRDRKQQLHPLVLTPARGQKRQLDSSSKAPKRSRKRQLDLFEQAPKRGRKPLKPKGHFGGSYLKGYSANCKRPMDTKKSLHLVLRSSQAKGSKSFKNKIFEAKIWDIVSLHAKKKDVSIYSYANAGNHLHILIRAKYREDYSAFIRTVTGLIARLVGGSKRGQPLRKKFWDGPPFSRIVSFAKKEFQTVQRYLLRNILEAIGWMPYFARGKKLPLEWDVALRVAPA